MEIILISNPNINSENIMNYACACCTSRNAKFGKDGNVYIRALQSGHESIAEHINFTFIIKDVSRAMTHQLVRHRHCSFSELSQRYTKIAIGEDDLKIIQDVLDGNPVSAQKAEDILNRYFVLDLSHYEDGFKNEMEYQCWMREVRFFCYVLKEYTDRINSGMAPEDARVILPNNTKTNILITLNLRELIHIANERLCSRAQREIRECVRHMTSIVKEMIPETGQFLVPKCVRYGKCSESKKCGFEKMIERKEHR